MDLEDKRRAHSSMGPKDERRAHSSSGPKDERRALSSSRTHPWARRMIGARSPPQVNPRHDAGNAASADGGSVDRRTPWRERPRRARHRRRDILPTPSSSFMRNGTAHSTHIRNSHYRRDLLLPYSLLDILPSQQVRTKINSQQTDSMLMSAHLLPVSTTTKLACCVQKKWL